MEIHFFGIKTKTTEYVMNIKNKIRFITTVVIIMLFSSSNVYGQMYVHQIYEQAQSELREYKITKITEDSPVINLYGFFAHPVSELVQKNSDGSYSYVITLKGTGGHGGFYFPELAEQFKYVEVKVDKNKISYYEQESQFVPSEFYTPEDTNDPMKIGHMKVPEDPFGTVSLYTLFEERQYQYDNYDDPEKIEESMARIENEIHKPGSSSFKTKIQIKGKKYTIDVRRNCTHSRVPLYRGTYVQGMGGVAISKNSRGKITRTDDPFPDHWFKHKQTLTYSLDEISQKTGMSKQDLIIYLIANDVLDIPYRNAFIVCAYRAFGLEKYKEQHRINDSLAREHIWNEEVLRERDYQRVANFSKDRKGDEYLFTQEFLNRIAQRSQDLKNDSIKNLLRISQDYINNKNYLAASKVAHHVLKIDKTNTRAVNLCSLSEYELIKENEINGRITERDYETYLSNNPTSPYIKDVENRRALYASSFLNKNTSDKEVERVHSLPCDAETKKIVDKRCKKLKYRFFHFGVGGELALGAANSSYSIEANTRIGHITQPINLSASVKYNYLKKTFGTPDSPDGGYFSKDYISIPTMLRINYYKSNDYSFMMYLGMGAELNVFTMNASFNWTEKIDDLNFSNNEFTMSPRLALGFCGETCDFELFGIYDIGSQYNKAYIDNYNSYHGMSSDFLIDPESYEKQLNSNKISNKLRIGISVRLYLLTF